MGLNYKQTLAYLYSCLPMFHRIGAAAYKADLDNTHALCKLLKHPENKFNSIHIAGTNGKGSSSHMLAAILQSKGLKVGLYTSPHLKDFRERIRINGKMIPKDYVSGFVNKYKKEVERIQPSFFEWTVGLCFDYFASEKVDIAILETGLGGRLDSTNVVTPLVSLITNISFDHMNLLGDTLEKIAFEKAGIIKQGIPVVISERQAATDAIFETTARKRKAALVFGSDVYKTDTRSKTQEARLDSEQYGFCVQVRKQGSVFIENLSCDLTGIYQKKNIAGVLAVVEELNKKGVDIAEKDIRKGLSRVKKLTGLRGRWEKLSDNPLTYADTGHNEAGIKEVLKNLKQVPYRNLFFVLGMVNDKDIRKILKLLPKEAEYFFCKANIPRGMDANKLQKTGKIYGLSGKVYPSVKKALEAAQFKAGKKDLVFVGGSTFTVGDAL
ncbi:MAG: bifunctional folylpolyglutamate synthase/dihydrofolate synthase [Bacteroidia bacterium]